MPHTVSRSSRRAPPRHAKHPSVAGADAPVMNSRVLSSEEKRQLILAHASRHAHGNEGWGAGYFIAIAASCLVVVTGWWTTLDTNMRRNLSPEVDPSWQALIVETESFQKDLREGSGADKNSLADRLEQAKQELEAEAKTRSTKPNETLN